MGRRVKGMRKLGGKGSGRTDKKKRERKVVSGQVDYGSTYTLSDTQQQAIDAASPSDARGLLDLLTVHVGDSLKLRGGKRRRTDTRSVPVADVEEPQEEAGDSAAPAEPGQKRKADGAAVDPAADPPYVAWRKAGLDVRLVGALKRLGFSQPTPVQNATLASAIGFGKDHIAAAETGSGKTLAFGLPIAHRILVGIDKGLQPEWHHRTLDCLVITPTRELAMQVQKHLTQVLEGLPLYSACVVGGMSDAKQLRLLDSSAKRPHFVVATPGRLWGMLEDGASEYLDRSVSKALRYLVVDEADRLLAPKHFAEVGQILERVRERNPGVITAAAKKPGRRRVGESHTVSGDSIADNTNWKETGFQTQMVQEFGSIDDFLKVWKREAEQGPYASKLVEGVDLLRKGGSVKDAISKGEGADCDVDEEAEEDEEDEEDEEVSLDGIEGVEEMSVGRQQPVAPPEPYEIPKPDRLRCFITSATLTLDRPTKSDKKIDTLKEIMQAFNLRERKCKVVDCTTSQKMVSTLKEAVVSCLDDEKDLYVYHFLRQHRGRTLVFVNTIGAVRRLQSILGLLNFPVFPLHSEMQQRQRLKNLDRLRDRADCVVVATDVAARGLDIKGVDYVVHYHFPRDTDTYIHRCGRTARAKASGFALSLVGPTEQQGFKKVCHALGRPDGLQSFFVSLTDLDILRETLSVVRQLDKAQNKRKKVKAHNSWLEKSAKEMGIAVDDNLRDRSFDDQGTDLSHQGRVASLQARLQQLLSGGATRAKGSFRHSAGSLVAEEARMRGKAKQSAIVGKARGAGPPRT
eukprot:TRINITY_DN3878_c0_g1_i1.p1 TRINITY_DN3878_c0_g1~~TRINITY_DN3878_c0_g1_i1.p1  ORF type:complete len:818 (+),score=225.48 TRINITY_DN3878_c0_g1_i1:57-2456(+)